jgi:uncharacterized protein YhaN
MKTHTHRILTLTTVAVTLATLLTTGCKSPTYKQADKTGAGIAEFRAEIANAKKAVDQTVATLGQVAVTADTNPRKAFEQYSKSLDTLESAAAKAKQRGADMKAQGQAYFQQWEAQLAQIQDPKIKALAQERRAKLQETFDSIRKYTEPLKAQFDPWLGHLKDLRTYLGSDLTVTGVDAAKPMFNKAQTEGLQVQQSMDALVAELNTVAATLTPANVKPKK